MKVKIKKKGKKKSYNLITSWGDVTLEKWIKIIAAQTGTKTKESDRDWETSPQEVIRL